MKMTKGIPFPFEEFFLMQNCLKKIGTCEYFHPFFTSRLNRLPVCFI